eukprot:scaffold36341_cov43-Cyclotella_meneghiniana.AAC.13
MAFHSFDEYGDIIMIVLSRFVAIEREFVERRVARAVKHASLIWSQGITRMSLKAAEQNFCFKTEKHGELTMTLRKGTESEEILHFERSSSH